MSKIIGIMACDSNGGVGYKNQMPWHIPSESSHFWQEVQSFPMIMGRLTFQSIPFNKINSNSIIISKTLNNNDDLKQHNIFIVNTTHQIRANLKQDKYYMIGGVNLLSSLVDDIDEFILTILDSEYQCDVFLNLKIFNNWQWAHLSKHQDGYNIYNIRP